MSRFKLFLLRVASRLLHRKIFIIDDETRAWYGLNEYMVRLEAVRRLRGVVIVRPDDGDLSSAEKLVDQTPVSGWTQLAVAGVNIYDAVKFEVQVELKVALDQIDIASEEHKGVVKRRLIRAVADAESLYAVWKRTKPESTVVVQGYIHNHYFLRGVCINENSNVFAIERPFLKDRVIVEKFTGQGVNRTMAKAYYWRYREFENLEMCRQFTKDLRARLRTSKNLEHISPERRLAKGDRKRVLVVGQVYTDSSQLLGCRGISGVDLMIGTIQWGLEHGIEVVIKGHPAEVEGKTILGEPLRQITGRKLKSEIERLGLAGRDGFVLDFENQWDTYSLIETADCVVTINSQAGLEALLFEREVIVAGESFYGGLGFTHEVSSRRELSSTLEGVLLLGERRWKQSDIDAFTYIYVKRFCRANSVGSIFDTIASDK